MPSLIHKAVSWRRRSADESGVGDVTYITPQLLVSSMPTNKYVQSWYRTSVAQIRDFLNTTHKDHWRVWNLQQDHEIAYADSDLDNKVTHTPFPDHAPMPLPRLLELVTAIHNYLQEDPKNVVLIHCKEGQGRSGSVICAYLQIYEGYSFEAANALFTSKRFRQFAGDGVSIASQVRYLRYIDCWKASGRFDLTGHDTPKVELTCIVLHNPKFLDVDVRLSDFPGITSRKEPLRNWERKHKPSGDGDKLVLKPGKAATPQLLSQDVTLTFGHKMHVKGLGVSTTYGVLWFNTAMQMLDTSEDAIPQRSAQSSLAESAGSGAVPGYFSCSWHHLEGIVGTSVKGMAAFDSIEIFWNTYP